MKGTILQISVSAGGLPKRAVAEGTITPLGIEGDFHSQPQIHGGREKAILLVTSEALNDLRAGGFRVFPGALGENLTTSGIDHRELRVGHQLRVGTAIIEITRLRAPCRALDVYGPEIKQAIFDVRAKDGDPQSPRWGMSGFYARVLREGLARPGDEVELLAALA